MTGPNTVVINSFAFEVTYVGHVSEQELVSEDGSIQHQVQHHEGHQQDKKGVAKTLVLIGHHPGDCVD